MRAVGSGVGTPAVHPRFPSRKASPRLSSTNLDELLPSWLSQSFNQVGVFRRVLDSQVVSLDRDINHTLNIFLRDNMGTEIVDDVSEVIKTFPEIRSLPLRLNKKSRAL